MSRTQKAAFAVALVLLAIFLLKRPHATHSDAIARAENEAAPSDAATTETDEAPSTKTAEPKPDVAVADAVPSASPAKNETSDQSARAKTMRSMTIAQATPSLDQIRAQAEKNPHTTPEAVIRFSIAIQERIEEGATDEEGAKSVFSELESCVSHPKDANSHSVQALCLLNAKRLAQKYPGLASRYSSLQAAAKPETVRRTEGLD